MFEFWNHVRVDHRYVSSNTSLPSSLMRQETEHGEWGRESRAWTRSRGSLFVVSVFSCVLTSSVRLSLSSICILKCDCWGSHSNIWQKGKALCSLETNKKTPWRYFIYDIHHLVRNVKYIKKQENETQNQEEKQGVEVDAWKLRGWKTSLMPT